MKKKKINKQFGREKFKTEKQMCKLSFSYEQAQPLSYYMTILIHLGVIFWGQSTCHPHTCTCVVVE